MGQISSFKIAASSGTITSEGPGAPDGATKAVLMSSAAFRAVVSAPGDLNKFASIGGFILGTQPTSGQQFFFGMNDVNSITTLTFGGTAGGNRVPIGATLGDTINNLITRIGSIAGMDGINYHSSTSSGYFILRKNTTGLPIGVGDLHYMSVAGVTPFVVPASGGSQYLTGGDGIYVPANTPIELECATGDIIHTRSLGTAGTVTVQFKA